jgi:hypothetical protein
MKSTKMYIFLLTLYINRSNIKGITKQRTLAMTEQEELEELQEYIEGITGKRYALDLTEAYQVAEGLEYVLDNGWSAKTATELVEQELDLV